MNKKQEISILYKQLFNEIFICTDDIKLQANLLKNKQILIDKIININKKYEEMLDEIYV